MRDPARLSQLICALTALWQRYPDMRFFQLVKCIEGKLPLDDVDFVKYFPNSIPPSEWNLQNMALMRDSFNTEDDVTIETIYKMLSEADRG